MYLYKYEVNISVYKEYLIQIQNTLYYYRYIRYKVNIYLK